MYVLKLFLYLLSIVSGLVSTKPIQDAGDVYRFYWPDAFSVGEVQFYTMAPDDTRVAYFINGTNQIYYNEKYFTDDETGDTLFNVALHELGHYIGMVHNTIPGSIMSNTITLSEVQGVRKVIHQPRRLLSREDINFIPVSKKK